MEQRGESLLGVVVPKYKPDLLLCQGLCSRAAVLFQRRGLLSSSQLCGAVGLQQEPKGCAVFSEAGGSSRALQRGRAALVPRHGRRCLLPALLCPAVSGAWHCVCCWART